ncbi:hypothetical protein BJ742DRAFT_849976 [Cladochytrium replicatum]|nr:hypothetical protein BJ742DRAFT_849976 [Cladochytrium replicatum]
MAVNMKKQGKEIVVPVLAPAAEQFGVIDVHTAASSASDSSGAKGRAMRAEESYWRAPSENLRIYLMLDRLVKLVLKIMGPQTLPAPPIALRVSSLDHEALDHAMELDMIVISLLCKLEIVLDGFGCIFGEQADVDVALLCGGLLGNEGSFEVRLHGGHLSIAKRLLVENITPLSCAIAHST